MDTSLIHEDIEYYRSEQIAHFQDKLRRIDAKVSDYKNQLNNFEEKFFAQLWKTIQY